MQVEGVEILWVVIGGSAILFTLAVGYVVAFVHSHRRILQSQQERLDEVSKSEEKFRGIFNNSLAGIIKFSVNTWSISDANEAIMELYGCSSLQELQSCMSNLPGSSLAFVRDSLTKDGFIAEYEIHTMRKDGGELWMLFSAKKMENDPCAQAVVVDITKRKQYEEKIREHRALLDQTQDAIMVVDYHGTVTFWNSGAELMYGWTKEEISGHAMEELLYSSQRRSDFHEAMEDISRFKEWNGEHYHTRKDGREILVESRWRTVRKGFNGTTEILIVNSDITEKKRLEAQFIRAQKMESVALLTGGMAHDLQNILAPIAMSVHLLKPKVNDDAGHAILKAVEESARSGLDLVKNILTYGRGIAGERATVNIGLVLDQVLSIVEQGLPESIRLERKLNSHKLCVLGDVNQLKQVFLNLCVNARDAMAAGGVLTVAVSDIDADESLLGDHPDADPGPYVLASVTDTGKGIREEDLEKIFEPFFTTREQGNGTGLGLSIAQGIVKSHMGFITVQSIENQGTTFRVYLPALVDAGN